MTGSGSEYDSDGVRQRLAAATERVDDDVDLELIVVRYENKPDRCTITPRECSDAERITTWLSADRTAFVDLAAVR
ncbi:DUF7511 domain-containing protein [Halopiger goleimassiliensis]|uniref:DUF7511 domain-containing protein n=1 Tax=Halopiger goleimassiliensis TaxID=1293048 RepID=UPI000677BFD7|nr:hypothetical protein [Halopiger goleimassiliensis]